MSYHIFNNLSELLNGDLTAKNGLAIHSHELLCRACNFLNPSKFNDKCFYKVKSRKRYLIYKVKFTLFDAIYMGNTQQIFKKIMDGHSLMSNVFPKIKLGCCLLQGTL